MLLFKQKTAYEMRISDWSSDVCSSDLGRGLDRLDHGACGAGLGAVADRRQVDVDQVAEQPLSMVGDADGDLAVAFDAGALVGFDEVQVAWDLAHAGAPDVLLSGEGGGEFSVGKARRPGAPAGGAVPPGNCGRECGRA